MQWNHKIFGVNNDNFEGLSLEIFQFQSINNPIYKAYLEALKVDPLSIHSIKEIPFLPIRFFKSHSVKTTAFDPAATFESSGTTGSINSRHLVRDLLLYEESFTRGFELFYGSIKKYCIIGLLPAYLERQHSSLVYMVDKLMQLSEHPQSGFYLYDHEKLFAVLSELEKRNQKVLLLGVTFALLDFADKFSLRLNHTSIMETGGMKGRREEMIREEVHEKLCKRFGVTRIHSEYGMTELLSQAYSKGNGVFNCPLWMKVMVRDDEDPLLVKEHGSGVINVIDLANVYSCSFIATDDAGRINADGSFEILGRVDGSDLRGCSLMVV